MNTEPAQINASTFWPWVEALQQAGLAVEIEPPSTESFHEKLTASSDLP